MAIIWYLVVRNNHQNDVHCSAWKNMWKDKVHWLATIYAAGIRQTLLCHCSLQMQCFSYFVECTRCHSTIVTRYMHSVYKCILAHFKDGNFGSVVWNSETLLLHFMTLIGSHDVVFLISGDMVKLMHKLRVWQSSCVNVIIAGMVCRYLLYARETTHENKFYYTLFDNSQLQSKSHNVNMYRTHQCTGTGTRRYP